MKLFFNSSVFNMSVMRRMSVHLGLLPELSLKIKRYKDLVHPKKFIASELVHRNMAHFLKEGLSWGPISVYCGLYEYLV